MGAKDDLPQFILDLNATVVQAEKDKSRFKHRGFLHR